MLQNSRKLLFQIFILLQLILYIVVIPGYSTDKATQIDALMCQYYKYDQFNGSVLVAENGKVIFEKGYGFANFEWKIPNAPDTKFRLGSITKQFTSMLIMQLVAEGKINVDDKIIKYLPDYPPKNGDRITVHHLLTHTSGTPNYTSLPEFRTKYVRQYYSPDDFMKIFSGLDLEFEPGSTFRYSNSGYFLLGVIIEKVTGKTYEQVLHEKIFDPLGLKDTGYDHSEPILEKRAAGYEASVGSLQNADFLDMSLPYAAGSLYSTVQDLYKWDQALYENKLLPEELKKKMFTPFLSNYAYGWGVGVKKIKDKNVTIISHGGGINGFNTLITRFIDDKHLIVLLNNTGGTNLNEMSQKISQILYGESYEMPKKPFALLFKDTRNLEDVEKSIQEYRENKDNYAANEGIINLLGYNFMNNNRFDEARKIFELNIELYPKSANTYDSIGEMYLKNGDNENAIKYYKKALEVDPNFESAKVVLKQLGVELK